MKFKSLLVVVVLSAGGSTAAQAPDGASLLAMAKAGRAAEAWKQWESAPVTWDHLRTGVALANAVGDVRRGLTIYTRLATEMGKPDFDALGSVAVTAASALAGEKDAEVAYGACGIVLRDQPNHVVCAPRLVSVGAAVGDVNARALDLYRMTNGGASGPASLYATFERSISGETRLEIATQLTRLKASERIQILLPIWDNEADRALRRPAASMLGEIGGPEALTALRGLMSHQLDFQSQVPVLLALALQGDRQGLDMAEQMRTVAVGPAAIDTQLALTAAGAGGASPPETLLSVVTGASRAHVALVLRDRRQELAKSAVRGLITDPAPPVRQAALRAAGILGMGLDLDIYNMMLETQPATRLKAIHAVLQTIDQQLGRAGARP